ncbi:quinone oxidoreductase family protein [Usitatibacter palustris]|uniref:Quinone oxidoreductase 1 n=1 Tax=Usitatibacter palustris TaxID=2732487 RepID=A0A6M4HAF6_9PROT|nr:quinone oxidoreductase [Usitatibacter palustris]QJR16232.1 Quinone oxidoreductase 1 [Usitatibacter palustris]
MPHAIRFHKTGGPEVLQWEEVAIGDPGPGEVRLDQKAAGLNYLDTYHRSGLYAMPLPSGVGMEGSAVVEAVGVGVTEFKVGDRVAYANGPIGSYSEKKIHPADRLVKLPDAISFEQGASMMLQGLTVRYLLRSLLLVPKSGDTVLVHAAAGGIGLIACQWAKALGINVIGTVSSEEKAKLAKEHGCTHTINYTTEDFHARVMEITGGKKVPIVYDSIGKDTWVKSLDCLQVRGLMVSFGNASGPVDGVNLGILAAKGSLSVVRPTLASFTAKREELVNGAKELFEHVIAGRIKVEPRQQYALKDAAQAHRDIEARKTTGSTILVP